MGKSEIQVSCNDQVLKITESPVLAAGGLNEVRIVFNFCEKWAGFIKTAIFYRTEDDVYYAILDENDTCIVPWEVCYDEGTFYFGVFGEKSGIRRTSNVVRYKVKKGAITSDMRPSEPTPDVYDQIIMEVANLRAENEEFKEAVGNAFADATKHNIAGIEKTGTEGLVDTYTITFLDGSTQTYTVTNGEKGEKGDTPVRGVDYWTQEDQNAILSKCCPSFTESGSAVVCEPVEGCPLNVVSHIVPVQEGSGDPSPDNVRPITGHTAVKLTQSGKNLIDPVQFLQKESGKRTTLDGDVFTTSFTDGGIHINAQASKRIYFPKGTYTFSFIPLTGGASVCLYVYTRSGASIASKQKLNASKASYTFTAEEDFAPCLAGDLQALGTYSYKLQMEVGTTATAYEPYGGETVTLDFGQTVYGGSLDWNTGILTVTHSSVVFDGVTTGKRMTTADGSAKTYVYVKALNGLPIKPGGVTYADRANCWVSQTSSIFFLGLSADITDVTDEDNSSTVVLKFNAVLKAWYDAGTPLTVVFEMAEPYTVQLTPQEILALAGVNTLYSATGDTEVKGKADPTAVIEKLTNAIIALGGNV